MGATERSRAKPNTKPFSITLTDEERRTLRLAAAQADTSSANLIRLWIQSLKGEKT